MQKHRHFQGMAVFFICISLPSSTDPSMHELSPFNENPLPEDFDVNLINTTRLNVTAKTGRPCTFGLSTQEVMKDTKRIVLIVLGTMVATICFAIVISASPYLGNS